MCVRGNTRPAIRWLVAERHTYILRLPPHLRNQLVDDAYNTGRSLNEVMRQALCEHYDMECPDITRGKKDVDASATVENFSLRVSEELFNEVRVEAQETGRSMGGIIIDALVRMS